MRGQKPAFSPVKSLNAVCIGGVHRLRLLEPLLPFADELRVFVHPTMQSTIWQLYFGPVVSAFPCRGNAGADSPEKVRHWTPCLKTFRRNG